MAETLLQETPITVLDRNEERHSGEYAARWEERPDDPRVLSPASHMSYVHFHNSAHGSVGEKHLTGSRCTQGPELS